MFSRETIINGISIIQIMPHAEIERMLIYFSIEEASTDNQKSRYVRANEVIKFLTQHLDLKGPKGNDFAFEIFEYIVNYVVERHIHQNENYNKFHNSLKCDGFTIVNDKIIRLLPEIVELQKRKQNFFSYSKNIRF